MLKLIHFSKLQIIPAFLLLCFLILGILIHKDYGISWDESISLNECGMSAWNAVVHGNWFEYTQNPEKYHGPAFELILMLVQKITGTEIIKNVYFLRHLVTFLFFWLSGVAFYRILVMRFNNLFLILSGICFYFMMPRIFADAFYNSKDLAFLSMICIGLYSTLRFLKQPDFKWAVIAGFCIGFAIGIRVLGILLFVIALFNYLVAKFGPDRELRKQYRIGPVVVFLLSSLFFIIAFWPILWLDPINHFLAAWTEMSKYRWEGSLLFEGKVFQASRLPWHYLPTWILITTPIPYIISFVIGIVGMTVMFFRKNTGTWNRLYVISISSLFLMPIISVILLNSVVYDGWRHVYFVYVPFCLISLEGLNFLNEYIRKKALKAMVRVLVVISITWTGYRMIDMHPYQNMYFNRLAGKNASEMKSYVEMDYWGLSYRELLVKLLEADKSPEIRLYTFNMPGYLNSLLLPDSSRRRLNFTEQLEDANYYITNFRGESTDFTRFTCVDSIVVDGAVISATYKTR